MVHKGMNTNSEHTRTKTHTHLYNATMGFSHEKGHETRPQCTSTHYTLSLSLVLFLYLAAFETGRYMRVRAKHLQYCAYIFPLIEFLVQR